MATHEENMKDPVWLVEQMRRYKEETATIQKQHDALAETVKALKVQLDAANATIAERDKERNAVEAALANSDANAKRTSDELAALTESSKALTARLTAELTATAAERDRYRKSAIDRRTSLAAVVTACGKTLEVASKHLEDPE